MVACGGAGYGHGSFNKRKIQIQNLEQGRHGVGTGRQLDRIAAAYCALANLRTSFLVKAGVQSRSLISFSVKIKIIKNHEK
jgi:hypothetical protein